jgi:hypothetical protein
MPDTLKTASKAMLPRALFAAGALALTFGVFAATAPAGAVPMQALPGLASPGLQVEDAGYRRAKKYQQLYADEAPTYGYRYPGYRPWMPYGGSVEIQELQRLFPETNWPPSMRY